MESRAYELYRKAVTKGDGNAGSDPDSVEAARLALECQLEMLIEDDLALGLEEGKLPDATRSGVVLGLLPPPCR